jgi:hypothetical protein
MSALETLLKKHFRTIAMLLHGNLALLHIALLIAYQNHPEQNLHFELERQPFLSTVITILLQAFAIVSARF